MHSLSVFHRVIYFKWSRRPGPMQRPTDHKNAANPNAARFQHLLDTLSISFVILDGVSVGLALEDVARNW